MNTHVHEFFQETVLRLLKQASDSLNELDADVFATFSSDVQNLVGYMRQHGDAYTKSVIAELWD